MGPTITLRDLCVASLQSRAPQHFHIQLQGPQSSAIISRGLSYIIWVLVLLTSETFLHKDKEVPVS